MSDVAGLTYELLQRLHADVADLRRDGASIGASLSSLERTHAAMSGDLLGIKAGVDGLRTDVSQIKQRLDL